MHSLALDVNVVSEEGARAEMRDEDDDLLRAAEELGIDLSGVRAAGNGAGVAPEEDPEAPADTPIDVQADAADEDVEEIVDADSLVAPIIDEDVDVDADIAGIDIDAEAPAET